MSRMRKKGVWICVMLAAMLLTLCGGCVPAYAAGTVTRTTEMDLTTMTTTADHLSSEGWKWEPTADGGTLTLRGFYMKADHATPYPHALIQGKGNVVIVLEGENVIETTSSWYWPLLSGDGKTVNWTIREGEKGSSLEFKMPESTAKNHLPYGDMYPVFWTPVQN